MSSRVFLLAPRTDVKEVLKGDGPTWSTLSVLLLTINRSTSAKCHITPPVFGSVLVLSCGVDSLKPWWDDRHSPELGNVDSQNLGYLSSLLIILQLSVPSYSTIKSNFSGLENSFPGFRWMDLKWEFLKSKVINENITHEWHWGNAFGNMSLWILGKLSALTAPCGVFLYCPLWITARLAWDSSVPLCSGLELSFSSSSMALNWRSTPVKCGSAHAAQASPVTSPCLPGCSSVMQDQVPGLGRPDGWNTFFISAAWWWIRATSVTAFTQHSFLSGFNEDEIWERMRPWKRFLRILTIFERRRLDYVFQLLIFLQGFYCYSDFNKWGCATHLPSLMAQMMLNLPGGAETRFSPWVGGRSPGGRNGKLHSRILPGVPMARGAWWWLQSTGRKGSDTTGATFSLEAGIIVMTVH